MAIAKRKKRFFEVDIPMINKQTFLQGFELKELDNKFIKYDLTRILKGKNALMQFKTKVENDVVITYARELKLLPCFLRRMVRKGTNYVEDSFIVTCKDAELKIKPFLITRRKVSRAVRRALREKAKEEIINYVKDKDSETIFKEVLRNQLQKPLSLSLKKVYPLSLCEIRQLKVEKELETVSEKAPAKEAIEEKAVEKESTSEEKKE